jgi:hypothetical protein
MNLLDCSINYFHTVPSILDLRPNALQVVLELHNGCRDTVPDKLRYQIGSHAERVAPQDFTFMLPAQLDFESLSYAAKKALIASYQKAKYSRTPFRIVITREQLAAGARLSVRHLRRALKELQEKRLVDIKQIWRDGIQISLLDPDGSGTPLYYIAEFNRMKLDSIPAYQWYRVLLHDDSIPADTRREWDARELDYVVQACPFCGGRKTFRVTLILNDSKSGYDKDCWYCHGCKRGGDSRRLWGLLHFYIDRTDWRDALTRIQLNLPAEEVTNKEVYEHVN